MISPKDQGILIAGLLTLSLLVSGGYLYLELDQPSSQKSRAGLPPLTPVPSVDQKQERSIREFKGNLARMVAPPEQEEKRLDLRMFGYTPMAEEPWGRPQRTPSRFLRDFNVTMAFVSNNNRFCVIDGRFQQQGDTLLDGTRIVKILPDRVLLDWHGTRKWVEVANIEAMPNTAEETDAKTP